VQSPKCGNWNEYLDKGAAIVVLEALGAVLGGVERGVDSVNAGPRRAHRPALDSGA
jgi:ATP-dependent helicase YprA (DUF1998 family)